MRTSASCRQAWKIICAKYAVGLVDSFYFKYIDLKKSPSLFTTHQTPERSGGNIFLKKGTGMKTEAVLVKSILQPRLRSLLR